MSTATQPPKVVESAPQGLWSSKPGWGIAANLTPPELVTSRRMHVIRRRVSVVAAVLVVVCVLGWGAAMWHSHLAANSLADAQADTAQLQAEQNKYATVTKMQGSVAEIQKQLAGLMVNDVDFATLVGAVRDQLPPGMTISQLAVTVDTKTAGAPAARAGSTTGGGASIDASGQPHIGTVTLSGTGITMSDVSTYLDRLKTIPGVLQPFPLTNLSTPAGVQYSLQLTLSDSLLTHRFDAAGGK